MKCKNRYCAYYFEEDCMCKEVEIGELGVCQSQKRILIPEETLHSLRMERIFQEDANRKQGTALSYLFQWT